MAGQHADDPIRQLAGRNTRQSRALDMARIIAPRNSQAKLLAMTPDELDQALADGTYAKLMNGDQPGGDAA